MFHRLRRAKEAPDVHVPVYTLSGVNSSADFDFFHQRLSGHRFQRAVFVLATHENATLASDRHVPEEVEALWQDVADKHYQRDAVGGFLRWHVRNHADAASLAKHFKVPHRELRQSWHVAATVHSKTYDFVGHRHGRDDDPVKRAARLHRFVELVASYALGHEAHVGRGQHALGPDNMAEHLLSSDEL